MQRNTACGVIAATLCLSAPALAQDEPTAPTDTIEVTRQLLTPSAGMMNDHMHEGGEFMVGLRFTRDRFSGANVSGSEPVPDSEVLAAGYPVRASAMTMDMAMLDLMFAPTGAITLMVMPHYMWHRMDMLGIDPMNTGGMTAGHGLAFGQVHSHGAEGFGDTLVSASYRLARSPSFNAHATLGLWVPTGHEGLTNSDGNFVHYGMQPGSGTWDVEPAVTLSGRSGGLGWGGQASYRWRTSARNSSGFAFGDKAQAGAWLSYLLGADVGATTRLAWEHEGAILGHYNAGHGHASPPDRQENYGGDTVSAGLGLNWLLPVASSHRPQLGVEVKVPVYQHLNGYQLARDWGMALSLAQTF
jgi:hypothetical protein